MTVPRLVWLYVVFSLAPRVVQSYLFNLSGSAARCFNLYRVAVRCFNLYCFAVRAVCYTKMCDYPMKVEVSITVCADFECVTPKVSFNPQKETETLIVLKPIVSGDYLVKSS